MGCDIVIGSEPCALLLLYQANDSVSTIEIQELCGYEQRDDDSLILISAELIFADGVKSKSFAQARARLLIVHPWQVLVSFFTISRAGRARIVVSDYARG